MGLAPGTIVLLPERRRLGGAPAAALARALERGAASGGASGTDAQLQRHVRTDPPGWAVAAIQRGAEAGDAGDATWLRADPVHIRAEMNGARLMAWSGLGLAPAEADAFLAALAPGFEESGVDIGRTHPEHWYLRLPPGLAPPAGIPPADALGDDLLAHLPAGDAGRAWRRLLSDAQVLLHQHPANTARTARGLPAVNSLWFWGGGAHPTRVEADFDAVDSADPQLLALAAAAGAAAAPAAGPGVLLRDLRHLRHWDAVGAALESPAGAATRSGALLDFADGQVVRLRALGGWRDWVRRWRGPALPDRPARD